MVFGTHQSEAKTHKLNFKHTSLEINDFNDLSDWIQFFRLPASHEATGNSMKEVKEHQWLFNLKKQQPRQKQLQMIDEIRLNFIGFCRRCKFY
jgi:hypothetical protein